MNQKQIVEFLIAKPGYMKTGEVRLALMLGCELELLKRAKKHIKSGKHSKELIIPEQNIEKKQFKRLFWDIETSYNVVSTWNVGYNLTITHDNIIKERAIICICWKWAGEKQVHSLEWNKGDDKQLLIDFIRVLNSADEIIGHNSDRFDEKWLRSRCIFNNVPMLPSYQTLDTLKLAKSGFRFNSNRLDYLGKFLGFGGKADTGGFKLWQKIVENNDQIAMNVMVKYCKRDVTLLENIYDRLNPYTKSKAHVGVAIGKDKTSCPNCGSDHTKNQGFRYLASGNKKQVRVCLKCGKGFTLPTVIVNN